jgi:hypothetical protein
MGIANQIVRRLERWPIMQMYHLFIALFFLRSIWLASPLKYPIIIVSLVNLFYRKEWLEKWSLVFYSMNFIGLWYLNYYIMANHQFLLALFTLFLTYRFWTGDNRFNYPRYIVALVICVATLQKLLSVYFLEGNLIGELVLSGTSFPLLASKFDPNFTENVAEFKTVFYGNKFNHLDLIKFQTTDAQVQFIKWMTYLVTALEVAISLILLFGKRNFRAISILVFFAATALFRSEFGFFSIVMLICAFDLDLQRSKWWVGFKTLFIIFLLTYCYIHFVKPFV